MERERDEALLLGWRGSGAFAGSLPGDEVRSIWQRRALVHAYRHHCPPNHRTVGNVALAVRGGGGSQALTHRMTRRPTSCPAHMCSRGHRRELRCLAGWLVGWLVAWLLTWLLACLLAAAAAAAAVSLVFLPARLSHARASLTVHLCIQIGQVLFTRRFVFFCYGKNKYLLSLLSLQII